jgi:hypothetical protein
LSFLRNAGAAFPGFASLNPGYTIRHFQKSGLLAVGTSASLL